jgi:hypothetical protein
MGGYTPETALKAQIRFEKAEFRGVIGIDEYVDDLSS